MSGADEDLYGAVAFLLTAVVATVFYFFPSRSPRETDKWARRHGLDPEHPYVVKWMDWQDQILLGLALISTIVSIVFFGLFFTYDIRRQDHVKRRLAVEDALVPQQHAPSGGHGHRDATATGTVLDTSVRVR
jgi:hypothetical protein